MAATTLYDGDGAVDFIKSSQEICELGCQCCIQLNNELQEAITELKSAMEITDILKDELDIAYANDRGTSSTRRQEEGTRLSA
jgi:hypothetical protein